MGELETNGYEAANQAALPPFAPTASPIASGATTPVPKGNIYAVRLALLGFGSAIERT